MTLTLRAVAASDLGLIRPNNEDTVHAGTRLIAVADGMGGAPAGDLASGIVMRWLARLDAADQADPAAALADAIEAANREVGESARADPAREGMGTTVTALFLQAGELTLLHVGDSRGYRLRAGALERLTRDETFVQALVDEGIISAEQARTHPHRSVVTQAVQGGPLHPVIRPVDAAAGDRLLVCSDGLSDVVPDGEIERALVACPDLDECARYLVGLARAAGGPDNITVVVADLAGC